MVDLRINNEQIAKAGKKRYFDLTKECLSLIAIYENSNKKGCRICDKEDRSKIYTGFKMSDKKEINVCCDVTFYLSSTTGKYIPRPTFRKIKNNFQESEQKEKEKVIVEFKDGKQVINFWKMISFLNGFKNLVDIDDFDNSYSVFSNNSYLVEFDNKETADKVEELNELITKAELSDNEIKNILYGSRRKNLESFLYLLENKESWNIYYKKYELEIKCSGEEYVWQHFLSKHQWFISLNTGLRFINDILLEQDIGIKNTSSKNSPQVDYLGISDYTTLIEIKTPSTKIFTDKKLKKTSRAGTWSFSSAFIDGISQCLAQKSSWDESHKSKDIIQNGKIVNQDIYRTVDSKVIFIIGNKEKEFSKDSKDIDIICKRDTFERFRRNNRNIDIITFDEIYERANHIVKLY